MSLRYEIRDHVLWFETQGDVEYDEGLDTLGAAIRDAGERAPGRRFDVVFDIRNSRESRSSRELRGIAEFVGSHAEVLSGRCVIVAGDAFHYGLGRMFGAYSESQGVEVGVVRDVGAAISWLQGEGTEPG